MLKKVLNGKKAKNIGIAELKVTVLLVYYTVLGIVGIVFFSYFIDSFAITGFKQFIICESTGNSNCNQLLQGTRTLYILVTFDLIMLSFTPLLIFCIYICDIQALKKKYKAWRPRAARNKRAPPAV